MHTKYVFVGYGIVFEMPRLTSGLKNTATAQILFFSAAHSGPSSSLLRLRFPKLYLAFKFLLSRFKNTATGRCIFFCRLLRAVTFTSPSSQSFTIPPDFFSSVFRRLKFLHGCHPLVSINDRLYVTVEQITNIIYSYLI